MFLQRQRRMNEISHSPVTYRHGSKLQDVLKKISIPEIKSHKKTNNYLNARNVLIDTTERIFRHEPKAMFKEEKTNQHQLYSRTQRPSSRQSHCEHHNDLSRRESRILAAKKYRERIGKRSDITPLIRAQEELAQSRKTENLRLSHMQSSERVERYRDMLKEFASQASGNKKELIKTYWLAGTSKRQSSSKHINPQLPVTNIEFKDQDETIRSPHSKVLASRPRRNNISYSSQAKRTSKGLNIHHDDNFIEPW